MNYINSRQYRTTAKRQTMNGCSCSTNTNGILETMLGSGGEPLTEIGLSLTPQTILMLGAVVLGAGLIIKKI